MAKYVNKVCQPMPFATLSILISNILKCGAVLPYGRKCLTLHYLSNTLKKVKNIMETIAKGKYVALAYKIFVVGAEQDVPVFEFTSEHPDAFVFGNDLSMIEGFMKNIEGLKKGDKFDFTLAPAEAFGEKNQDMIIPIEKDIFKNGDGEFDTERVALGNYVPMMTANGQRVEGLVIEITDTHVTLDFNHQLAGESVRYQGEVLVVRDATDAELHPHQGCGSCSGNCGDGGCSGCSGCN